MILVFWLQLDVELNDSDSGGDSRFYPSGLGHEKDQTAFVYMWCFSAVCRA